MISYQHIRWIHLQGPIRQQSLLNLEIYMETLPLQIGHYSYPPRKDYGEQGFPIERGTPHHQVHSVLR